MRLSRQLGKTTMLKLTDTPEYQSYGNDADIPAWLIIRNYRATKRILANPQKFSRANLRHVEDLNNALWLEGALRLIPEFLCNERSIENGVSK
jgi:hypothetical protein